MKHHRFLNTLTPLVILLVVGLLLGACGAAPDAALDQPTEEGVAPTVTAVTAMADPPPDAASERFDPDREPDNIAFDDLEAALGPVPEPSRDYTVGVVVKFLGNPYWTVLTEGMQTQAAEYGITLDVQSAESEADQLGQLELMEQMIDQGYDAILISPQTDTNLLPAVERAEAAGILVLNVNDAVLPDAQHWVGPNQYENGVRAATYLIETRPDGGNVAIIEGQTGVYAAGQRTQGFRDTLQGTPFDVVASIPADWDQELAYDIATAIMENYPNLIAFYCNNDIMALGVVEALRDAGSLDDVIVIGTDGIEPAYDSIRAGALTGTIDSFPFTTGQAAINVLVRLLEGQKVPRAVYSPQNLIIQENVDNPQQPAP